MEFSEKLTLLRKKEGLSQEQLADRLGVTRQSVSKWESGTAVPELVKIISLSEMFGVSVDYLIKDYMEEPDSAEESSADTARLEKKVDDLSQYLRGWTYAYDSSVKMFGLPLFSVRFAFGRHMRIKDCTARGIIAIGNFSVGIVSLGIISLGVLSLGIIALGGLAVGVVALGYLALCVSGMGVYAAGVAVNGWKIAVGVAAAAGETAVGCDADAANVLLCGNGLSMGEVESFLQTHHPGLWKPLLRLFSALGANIK